MFDYTTKDGRLRIYETSSDFQIMLQNGEQRGMGDGVDSFLSALFDLDEESDEKLVNRTLDGIEEVIESSKWDLINGYFGYERGDEPVRDDSELEAEYRAEIEAWNWLSLRADAISNAENSEDGESGFTWVGSVYALCPSGKMYAMWTSNQTDWDVRRDEIWWEVLNEVALKNQMWVTDGAESDHIYLGCELPDDEESEDDDDDESEG